MKKDTMAKLPGLFPRKSVYQLRVIIPLEIRAAYAGKTKLIQSLNTTNLREAELLGTKERARLLEEFNHKRLTLSPQRLGTVTPEMSAELALRVRAGVLRVDDAAREDPKIQAALGKIHALATRSALTLAPTPPVTPGHLRDLLSGLSEGEATALAALNDIRSANAGVHLALRNLQSILPLVMEEAHKLGLTFDPHAPGAREALQASLKAYRQAWQEVTQRDAGEIVDTPALSPLRKSSIKPMKLRDVYARWKAAKPDRSTDSVNTCLRAVTLYEEFTGNPAITELTREQGDGFRTWLQHPDRKTTSKTARDRLTWVKSVLKYAYLDLGLLPRNPWEGLDISFKTTNKRRPWTDEELTQFFAQPLHTTYKLPKDKKAGADAAYWIPLLGLYTGARVSELAQLQVCDVMLEGEVYVLSITDEGESQSVKSAAGVRKVPIHGELVRLGFLDYVESLKARKIALLWPLLVTREGKQGGYFSHWFGQYRRSPAVGFGLKPDFHCLRHTVRTLLADQEVSEQDMDLLMGHENKGSTGSKVYSPGTLKRLQRAVTTLHYPALTLPRIYPEVPLKVHEQMLSMPDAGP